jgi:hypothetical protein
MKRTPFSPIVSTSNAYQQILSPGREGPVNPKKSLERDKIRSKPYQRENFNG